MDTIIKVSHFDFDRPLTTPRGGGGDADVNHDFSFAAFIQSEADLRYLVDDGVDGPFAEVGITGLSEAIFVISVPRVIISGALEFQAGVNLL